MPANVQYQWLRDGRPISGQTGATYRLTANDAGHKITVRATYKDNAGHDENISSTPTAEIAAQPPTILWAYAELLASHGAAVERAQKVRDYGLAHNEDELSSEEVAYTFPAGADQGDVIANVAHDIGSLALTVFGTDYYYYSAPIGGGSRMVLLLENLSEPMPPITLNELYARLPRYLQQVDDIPWSLEGFVELMPGWSLELNDDADAHHARITDDTGRSIRVTYQLDQYDRLTRLEMGLDD